MTILYDQRSLNYKHLKIALTHKHKPKFFSNLTFSGARGCDGQRSKLEGNHDRDWCHPHGPLRRGHLCCDIDATGSGPEGQGFKVHN